MRRVAGLLFWFVPMLAWGMVIAANEDWIVGVITPHTEGRELPTKLALTAVLLIPYLTYMVVAMWLVRKRWPNFKL